MSRREDEKFYVNTPSLRDKFVFWWENKLPTVTLACWTNTYLRNESRCKSAECFQSSSIRLKVYARICRRIWHELRIPRRRDIGRVPQTGFVSLFPRQKLHYLELLRRTAWTQRLPDHNYVLNIPHTKSFELCSSRRWGSQREARSTFLSVRAHCYRARSKGHEYRRDLIVITFITTTCDRRRMSLRGTIIHAEVTRAGNYV